MKKNRDILRGRNSMANFLVAIRHVLSSFLPNCHDEKINATAPNLKP